MSPYTMIAKSGPIGIPAMGGGVPGSAVVTMLDFDGKTFVPAGTEVAVNVDVEPVEPDRFLQLIPIAGNLCVVAVEC